MRDFTKSVFSFSWALSLFGFQQTLNIMNPSKAAKAFDHVTEAAMAGMGDPLKSTFKAADNLQRGMADLTPGLLTGEALNPSKWVKMTSDVINQSAEAVGQGIRAATSGGSQAASGWGPASGQSRASAASSPGAEPGPSQGSRPSSGNADGK